MQLLLAALRRARSQTAVADRGRELMRVERSIKLSLAGAFGGSLYVQKR